MDKSTMTFHIWIFTMQIGLQTTLRLQGKTTFKSNSQLQREKFQLFGCLQASPPLLPVPPQLPKWCSAGLLHHCLVQKPSVCVVCGRSLSLFYVNMTKGVRVCVVGVILLKATPFLRFPAARSSPSQLDEFTSRPSRGLLWNIMKPSWQVWGPKSHTLTHTTHTHKELFCCPSENLRFLFFSGDKTIHWVSCRTGLCCSLYKRTLKSLKDCESGTGRSEVMPGDKRAVVILFFFGMGITKSRPWKSQTRNRGAKNQVDILEIRSFNVCLVALLQVGHMHCMSNKQELVKRPKCVGCRKELDTSDQLAKRKQIEKNV